MAHDLTVRSPGARCLVITTRELRASERFTIGDLDMIVHATDTEPFACVEEAPAAA